MSEFEINGIPYKSTKLNAKDQWHITRRLLPVLTGIRPLAIAWAQAEIAKNEAEKAETPEAKAKALAQEVEFAKTREEMLKGLAESLKQLSDEDSDFIIDLCMSKTMRNPGTGWVAIWNKAAGREMFPDIDMGLMLTVVGTIIQGEMANFFA